jgi:hypothetical protein
MSNNHLSEAISLQRDNPEDYKAKVKLTEELFNNPIPHDERLYNIALFLDRRIISRFLFINEIYQKVIPLHGVMMEFGMSYGQNMALIQNLRTIYEPFNANRKLIGFDTFEGFPVVAPEDGSGIKEGDYTVPENYQPYLTKILKHHQDNSALPHANLTELVKGDASLTVPQYLKSHPETIISFAYFDMDIYKPTKDVLQAIIPHLTKGAVIAFDEINDVNWPGETIALREVLGTNKYKIYHSPFRGTAAYLIYE